MLTTRVEEIYKEIDVFCQTTHGSSDYGDSGVFVMGRNHNSFAPLKYLHKKISWLSDMPTLLKEGFVVDSYEIVQEESFRPWYESQFSCKLLNKVARTIEICYCPDDKNIFDTIEEIHKCYEHLRKQKVLLNSKNLPIQLGEWYAKNIFGLKQVKSASQRGFDFFVDGKRIEVKVTWGDKSSPKGIKIKKSLVELSDYCIIVYVAKNFMIREICYMDSAFTLKKFSTKSHTLFIKDQDANQYFLSKSSRFANTIVNNTILMKYSSPMLAMKIAEYFQ